MISVPVPDPVRSGCVSLIKVVMLCLIKIAPIPLFHTTYQYHSILFKKSSHTGMIPGNVEHWYARGLAQPGRTPNERACLTSDWETSHHVKLLLDPTLLNMAT